MRCISLVTTSLPEWIVANTEVGRSAADHSRLLGRVSIGTPAPFRQWPCNRLSGSVAEPARLSWLAGSLTIIRNIEGVSNLCGYSQPR